MKPGEYAEADANPAGDSYLDFAGPFEGPTLRTRAKLSQGGITYPPMQTNTIQTGQITISFDGFTGPTWTAEAAS